MALSESRPITIQTLLSKCTLVVTTIIWHWGFLAGGLEASASFLFSLSVLFIVWKHTHDHPVLFFLTLKAFCTDMHMWPTQTCGACTNTFTHVHVHTCALALFISFKSAKHREFLFLKCICVFPCDCGLSSIMLEWVIRSNTILTLFFEAATLFNLLSPQHCRHPPSGKGGNKRRMKRGKMRDREREMQLK